MGRLEIADPPDLARQLRPCGERHGEEATRDQRHKGAPLHRVTLVQLNHPARRMRLCSASSQGICCSVKVSSHEDLHDEPKGITAPRPSAGRCAPRSSRSEFSLEVSHVEMSQHEFHLLLYSPVTLLSSRVLFRINFRSFSENVHVPTVLHPGGTGLRTWNRTFPSFRVKVSLVARPQRVREV